MLKDHGLPAVRVEIPDRLLTFKHQEPGEGCAFCFPEPLFKDKPSFRDQAVRLFFPGDDAFFQGICCFLRKSLVNWLWLSFMSL